MRGSARHSTMVLGAGGHIGSAVVRACVEAGWRVTGVVRRPQTPVSLEGSAVEFVLAERALDHAAGQDLIVDAAAPYPLQLGAPRSAAAAGAAHVAWILSLARRSQAPLVHVGSFATAPRRSDPVAIYARQAHPYFSTKALIEDELGRAAAHGLPITVVQPTMCIGPGDPKPRELCPIPQLACGELPVSADHVLNLIDVRDVAAAILAIATQRRFGQTIPLVGHELTMPDAARWVAAWAGVRPPSTVIPTGVGVVALAALETALRAMGLQPRTPTLAWMLLHELPRGLRAEGLQRALLPRLRPLEHSLTDALAWYRARGYC